MHFCFSSKQNGHFYKLEKALMDRNRLGPHKKHSIQVRKNRCFLLRNLIFMLYVPNVSGLNLFSQHYMLYIFLMSTAVTAEQELA